MTAARLARRSWLRTAAFFCALGPALALAAPADKLRPMAPVDPKLVDEMAADLILYTQEVIGFRQAAKGIVKRTYHEKLKAIRDKYEPMIVANEKEEKERRMDAIAVLEGFLRKYPADKRWTPDVMFRLAELYYEKASDEFLTAQEDYQKAFDSDNPPTTPPPKADYNQTVTLYRRLLTEFPNYRLLDATYYLLGFCLGEMGQEPEARQALLALVCSNQYKPLDKPAERKPATGMGQGPLEDYYKDCVPIKKDSKFLPEAWTRVGEMHFDAAELAWAISAYGRVLQWKESAYYDKAIYKLAWSYYRDNRFVEAIREFDGLVGWADSKKAAGDKFGSDLRPEAVQYLGISFSEPDWDGDTLPDAETGLQRAQSFYRGREGEPHVKEVFQRLGDIYFDSTKYAEAIAVYKYILQMWPFFGDAPKLQEKIVKAYERDRNLVAAAKEREQLGRNYSKGSEWYRQNTNNPEALAVAAQLAEDALLTAATNVHAGAQACRAKAQQAGSVEAAECQETYRTAAELYEKYLAAYPNSKRAYEFSAFYADALYYGGKVAESIPAYVAVRDSNVDNKYQQDAALQVIKALEQIIDRYRQERRIEDPPIPDEKNTKPPVTPLPMHELYAQYMRALDWYVANLPDERAPDLRYASAVILLKHRMWPEARARLGEITDAYCDSKPDVGFRAYDAILTTYFIDYSIEDEEAKDCALGRLLQVVDKFSDSPCSKAAQAKPYLSRIADIKASVKTTVIKKRLDIALENEEKGTNKQLVQCREGPGGIAIVTGAAALPKLAAGEKPAAAGAQPRSKTGTELDEGLALDLMDLIAANPKDQDAASNLNNACVIYEKIYKYGEATKCYERLARDYAQSPLANDAVWNAARNQYRFFEFDKAVSGYLRVATDPKFADYEHRKEALGIAAQLLDNDQQYPRAAELYKKYADNIAEKPSDSAQAYSFACTALHKAKEHGKESACLRELIKRYGKQPEAGEYVVKAYLGLAHLAEQGRDKRALLAAYKKVRNEFLARRLPAATPAAAAAAKADFLILEEKFRAFQAKTLRFGNDPKKVRKVFDAFTAEAKDLQEEYAKIWEYKDATWTLASFLRRGDIFYEFAQKLIKAADNPPDEIKRLSKKACKLDPELCGVAETEYKDAIFQFVTPVEDEAKRQWKATLNRAADLGVTNEYVKKARENLSKYLPDEFPFIKDERIGVELP
ncbi:MAG: tetratricopeptide repeat protein [Deltaproteobacteria bacterium]|nr:tetratricopeptide repeat protein [Deltaproteobacteria bacterium]